MEAVRNNTDAALNATIQGASVGDVYGTNPVAILINVSRTGNGIRLDWKNGTVQLQEADSISGAWRAVVGNPLSPYVIGLTGTTKFFRLHRP